MNARAPGPVCDTPPSRHLPALSDNESSGQSAWAIRRGHNITRPGHSARKRKRELDKLEERREKAERKRLRKEGSLTVGADGAELAVPVDGASDAEPRLPPSDPTPA